MSGTVGGVMDLLAPVPSGDRPLAQTALDRLAAAPAEIGSHSRRMIMMARALAGDRPVDQALLVAACAVHDLGLLSGTAQRWPRLGFPDRSAAVLAELAEHHGLARDRSDPWCWAIAGHLRPLAPAGETTEASLLRRAAWLDAGGVGSRADRAVVRRLELSRSTPQTARLLARVGAACARDLIR
ncbi:MAG TPA: HD domain-containing protein [Microlunatus sp.]